MCNISIPRPLIRAFWSDLTGSSLKNHPPDRSASRLEVLWPSEEFGGSEVDALYPNGSEQGEPLVKGKEYLFQNQEILTRIPLRGLTRVSDQEISLWIEFVFQTRKSFRGLTRLLFHLLCLSHWTVHLHASSRLYRKPISEIRRTLSQRWMN